MDFKNDDRQSQRRISPDVEEIKGASSLKELEQCMESNQIEFINFSEFPSVCVQPL